MLIGGQATGMNAALRMRSDASRFLAVGEHVIDIDTLRVLTRSDGTRLTPKAAAVLLQLARAAGRTLSRDELLNEVWKGTCPTPDVLTQAVKDLRRALGDDLHAPRYVETLPRLGYRLVAAAQFLDAYAAADSTHLAAVAEHPALDARVAPARPTRALVQRPIARTALIGAAALVLLAFVAVLLRKDPGHASESPPRWQASEQRSVTADPGPENFPRISPDGTRVAYSIGDAQMHNARIVQRSLTQSRVVHLTQATVGEEFFPVWSPDGATIAFTRHDGNECKILLASALGGPERLAGSCFNASVNYFSWSPDGKHLITTAQSAPEASDLSIVLLSVDGGAAERLPYEHSATDIDLDPRYSPDGSKIAFRRGASPYSDLFVMDARGGAVRQLTHLASRMRGFDWTRDGSALIFSSGHGGQQALYAVAIDDARIDALGVQPAEFPSGARASDTVVYEIPRMRTQLATVPIDGGENTMHDVVPSTGNDGAPVFSPVDDRLAFVSDRSGSQQLWLYDPAGAETFALTESTEPTLRYPVWRPDGARLLITARASSGSLIEIDIATRARRVLTSPDEDVRYGVYGPRPDSYIAVVGVNGEERKLVELDTDGKGGTTRTVLARGVGRIDFDHGDSSVYYTKIGQAGLFRLDPKSGDETMVTHEINAAHLDGWMVRNGEVYYIAPRAIGPSDVHVLDPIAHTDRVVTTIPNSVADLNFSVSHDGRSIVVVRVAAQDTDVGAVTLRRVRAP
jgi:Tol biopolymer transport system component/DNA-binding winged helix-turn-helix (wHTH) protein